MQTLLSGVRVRDLAVKHFITRVGDEGVEGGERFADVDCGGAAAFRFGGGEGDEVGMGGGEVLHHGGEGVLDAWLECIRWVGVLALGHSASHDLRAFTGADLGFEGGGEVGGGVGVEGGGVEHVLAEEGVGEADFGHAPVA